LRLIANDIFLEEICFNSESLNITNVGYQDIHFIEFFNVPSTTWKWTSLILQRILQYLIEHFFFLQCFIASHHIAVGYALHNFLWRKRKYLTLYGNNTTCISQRKPSCYPLFKPVLPFNLMMFQKLTTITINRLCQELAFFLK